MLSEREIKKKIYEQADIFKNYYLRKDWHRAKWSHFIALHVANFVELSENEMSELFGNRPYRIDEPISDGLFREAEVERAYLECIKRNDTYDARKLEH